jgi:hypothetical protein
LRTPVWGQPQQCFRSVFNIDVSDTETAFAMALGGGVDVRVGGPFSVRLGQLDYLMTRFGDTRQNNFRFSAGVVIGLGSK